MPKNSQPGDYVPKSLDQVFKDVPTVWTPRLRPRLEGKAVTGSSAKPDVDNLAEQLAAIKITDRAGKGSSGKPRTIKIGEVVLAEGDVQEFQVNIDVAKAMLETRTMFNLNDLNDARNSLDKLSNKNKALSNFINKNAKSKFEKYQVVSFSALTEEHLLDMGVTSRTLSRNHFERILEVFNTFFLTSKQTPRAERPAGIFERFWNGLTKDGRYIKDFKILKNNIGKKPEARARMLTDYILTQLMVFVHEYLKLVQLTFVELLLSSSSDPIAIIYKNTATLLTGSVDYAILSSLDARAGLARSLGVGIDDVDTTIMEMSSENSLDSIMDSKLGPLLRESKHFKFTIIEEKRKELRTKNLEACKPQVTGEALALGSKARLDHVLWCLSNGEEWIFGVLINSKSQSLPPIFIRDNDLEGSIQSILKMLILWTACPVGNLKQLLSLE